MRRGAPPFPSCEADLEAWAVYADELQARGDVRGALVAADLALTANADQLREFQRSCARVCRVPGQRFSFAGPLSVEWCLGHARSLEVNPEFDGLERARAFVESPLGQTVSSLRVGMLEFADLDSARLRALRAALPPECQRLEVMLYGIEHPYLAETALSLFGRVRELSLLFLGMRPELFVSDQFEELDLRFLRLSAPTLDAITTALNRTNRVRIRVGDVEAPLESLSSERFVLGHPDDAMLYDLVHPGCAVLQRTPLTQLQLRRGFLSARAQLNRWPVERWGLTLRPQGITLSPYAGSHFARHAGGRWTLRMSEPSLPLALNDEALPLGEAVPLESGDVVSVLNDARAWRFEAPDADR